MKTFRWKINTVHVTFILAAATTMVLLSSAAFGAVYQFVPTLTDYEGELDVGVTHEKDENTINGKRSKTKDTAAMERLRVNTFGYVYHPRFIIFNIGGAFGLMQESFDRSGDGSLRETRSANEYKVSATILPEHPYNLELYALQQQPFTKPRFLPTRMSSHEQGALFRYENKPLVVHLSATRNSTVSTITADTRTYRGSVGCYVGPFSNSAGYNHVNSANSLLVHNTRNQFFFSNSLRLPSLTLLSRFDKNLMKQEDPRSAFMKDETITWTEQLNAELPGRLQGSAAYNYMSDTLSTAQTASMSEDTTTSEASNLGFSLSHQLYHSLRTTYTQNHISTDTTGGSSSSGSRSISSQYAKNIPYGRFVAGVNLSRSQASINSAPFKVLNELHTLLTPIDNSFTLKFPSVDETTIKVWVEAAGSLILMIPDDNYQIIKVGNTVEIIVKSLPPGVVDRSLPSYTFRVNYSLLPSNVEFRTDVLGYSLTASLFQNLMAPYFSHTSNTQEALSGSFPGGLDNTRVDAVGVILQKRPFTLQTEFESFSSRLNPYRKWKNVFEYRDSIAKKTDLIARLFLARSKYPATIEQQGKMGATEDEAVIDVFLQHRLPEKHLDLSLETSYTRKKNFVDSAGYKLNAFLAWSMGKLSVNAGAQFNEVTTSYLTGRQTTMTEYYYVTISRKLF